MNGSPREFFESTRGIWQGVLLSPILFLVLLWKLLIGLISKAVEQGYLSGFPADTASDALMKISYYLSWMIILFSVMQLQYLRHALSCLRLKA